MAGADGMKNMIRRKNIGIISSYTWCKYRIIWKRSLWKEIETSKLEKYNASRVLHLNYWNATEKI